MAEAKAAIGVAMEAIGGTVDGGEIGGKTIELIYAGTDGTSGSAQTQVKKLVENDGVDIVFGPVSGDEGEAVVQYALTVPEVTFVNGSASPVGMTLEGAENFFRFHGDSAMWMGGLGNYAYDEKGYEKIYSIAEDYSFPYDNAGGFFSEFCEAGGEVNGNSWVPVGTTDYATIIAQIPADTDAVYVGLGGADAASFLSQAVTNGVNLPLVGGSIAVDTTALSGDANISSAAVGTITGGPVPGAGYDNPEWQPFVDAYVTQPDAFPSPSIFSILYYNSFQSLVLGLQEVDGDLSDGHAALRDALGNLDWNSPTGPISMDENRQAIVDNFLIEVLDEGRHAGPEEHQRGIRRDAGHRRSTTASRVARNQQYRAGVRERAGPPPSLLKGPNMADPALVVRDVSKSFGGVKAIRDVSLEIAAGERISVIGTNGAGKSTLFNTIAGVFPPTTGSIHLFGEDVTKLSTATRARRGLARTFQTSRLFEQLSAADNVFIALGGNEFRGGLLRLGQEQPEAVGARRAASRSSRPRRPGRTARRRPLARRAAPARTGDGARTPAEAADARRTGRGLLSGRAWSPHHAAARASAGDHTAADRARHGHRPRRGSPRRRHARRREDPRGHARRDPQQRPRSRDLPGRVH